jgi:chromosome segregation ATPase
MATTPPPSAGASEPKPSTSEAIQTGADVFVAFFEIELAKATAASKRTIRDLEARFSEFQKSSHSSAVIYTRRCADLEAAIRSTRTAHAQAVAECSLARTRISEAQQQLAKVKHELDHLKNCSRTEHSSCLQFTPEQAGNGATVTPKEMQNCDAEVQADDLNMLFSLGELRRQLMSTQQLLEGKERDCKAVEKERDDLKAAMGTEAMMLNNRIFSLQAELESLKDSHARSQTGSRDKDMPVGETTHSVVHDTTAPTSSAPREDGSQKGEHTVVQRIDIAFMFQMPFLH